MKKIKLNKTLTLKKESLSSLNKTRMESIRAGGIWTFDGNCTGGCTDGCTTGGFFKTNWNCTEDLCTRDCKDAC